MTIYWYGSSPSEDQVVTLDTLASLGRILKKHGNRKTKIPNRAAAEGKHICIDPFMQEVYDEVQVLIADTFEALVKVFNEHVDEI